MGPVVKFYKRMGCKMNEIKYHGGQNTVLLKKMRSNNFCLLCNCEPKVFDDLINEKRDDRITTLNLKKTKDDLTKLKG